tara:strand:+ start:37 stop:1926 length:1890 start_codon:yes stop_codon:yes gene_type:complete
MALGASSFSPVSTGFTKDSKAMIPVSIQGVGGQVQKMSSFETMQEIFFDIRDGIESLSDVFSEKISGLNEHLAFRFESLNSTLLNIAGMTDKQLDIDKKTGKIIQDNEKEDERDESLNKDDKKFNGRKFLKNIQERFNGLVDLLSPKSEIAKVGLLGALTLGIVALLPKLEKALAGVFEFTGEKLIPFLDNIFEKMGLDIKNDETGELNWNNILGVGLGAYVATKIVPPLLGALIFKVPGGGRVVGYVALAAWAMGSALAKVGDVVAAQEWTKLDGATDSKLANSIGAALGGNIEGGVMNAFTNASKMAGTFALIGAGIGSVVPVVGTLVGGLIGGAIGLVVGGIMGFFGGGKIAKFLVSISDFVSGAYTKMVNKIKGFFFDEEIGTPDGIYTKRSMLGEAKDIMAADFKLMGEQLKDFFYDDQGNLFGIDFGFLKDILPSIRQIAATILSYLPDWMRPDSLNEKILEQENIITKEQERIARSQSGVNEYKFTGEEQGIKGSNTRIKNAKRKIEELEIKFREEFPGLEPGTSELILDNDGGSMANDNGKIIASDVGSMALKTTEFKSLIDSKESEDSGSTSMIVAPSSITKDSGNTTVIDSHVSTGSLAVDAKDPTARKLDAFMAAAAG